MAEKDEQYTDENAESDFAAGFTNPNTQQPAVVKGGDDKQDAPADDQTDGSKSDAEDPKDPPADGETPPADDPPADENVIVTKAQLERLLAAADKAEGYEKQISKLFGTLGDTQAHVKALQASTPKGVKVEIPADAFKEMEEEYPEIAAHMKASLEKALSGAKGTGAEDDKQDTPAEGIKPEAVERIVEDSVSRREMALLTEDHPDWRTVVGAVEKGQQPDPNNGFRKWLKTQPADYQQKINETQSPLTVSRAIDKYKAFEAAQKTKQPSPPNKKNAAREDRFSSAVQPRGDGNPPPPKKTADDEFQAGFKSG